MMRTAQLLRALAFEPKFCFCRPAQRAGAMLAGVVQADAIVSVRTFINMVPLGARSAGADVPRCTSAACLKSVRRLYGRIVIVEYLLYRARLHPVPL